MNLSLEATLTSILLLSLHSADAAVAKRKERSEDDGSICETSDHAMSPQSQRLATGFHPAKPTNEQAAARERFSPLLQQRNWPAQWQIDVVARFKRRHQEKYGGVKAARRQHIARTSPTARHDRVARKSKYNQCVVLLRLRPPT